MAESIAEVLPYAIGVAISPVPVIAVILVLFSARAKVNGPMFLAGWVVASGAVSAVAYVLADAGDAATDTTTADTISWGQIAIGAFLLLVAARQWRRRPAPDTDAEMPKWMAGIDSFSPFKSFALALVLAGVNPKNFLLSAGAGEADARRHEGLARRPQCCGDGNTLRRLRCQADRRRPSRARRLTRRGSRPAGVTVTLD